MSCQCLRLHTLFEIKTIFLISVINTYNPQLMTITAKILKYGKMILNDSDYLQSIVPCMACHQAMASYNQMAIESLA